MYDGVVYNVEMIKDLFGDLFDMLYFDEVWLLYVMFYDFYCDMYVIGDGWLCMGVFVFVMYLMYKLFVGIL